MDKPTFQPSLLCERPGVRCHSYITAGKIQFCNDSKHKFAGQTLEIPDWDQQQKETAPMAEKKDFKPGDQVKLLAPHVSGIAAEVVNTNEPNGRIVCVITSSEHPSGHSQQGTLVMFGADQLESVEVPKVPEVSL